MCVYVGAGHTFAHVCAYVNMGQAHSNSSWTKSLLPDSGN